jgi:hypothetical protein
MRQYYLGLLGLEDYTNQAVLPNSLRDDITNLMDNIGFPYVLQGSQLVAGGESISMNMLDSRAKHRLLDKILKGANSGK